MNLSENTSILNRGFRTASLCIVHCAFCIATSVTVSSAFAELTVTDVAARQRWPWNSLVDIDFTVNGDAGEAYYIDVSATAEGGAKLLEAKTFVTEPIAQSGRRTRLVWNFGADYPNYRANDLQIQVSATPFSDTTPVYLVVDMSGGLDAQSWPVRYMTAEPVHTAGVEDPCKTTELWLKRVKAGTVGLGAGTGAFTCVLTNDFYLGVFTLTQFQSKWLNMTSSNMRDQGCSFTNATCRMTRPADSLKYAAVRGNYYDSSNAATEIPNGGVLKKLNDRTGLVFDMPTEWQWEFACRAGSADTVYEGAEFRHSGNSKPSSDYEWYDEQGMWDANYGTSYVDEYSPNPWGFYGMLGNVREICRNAAQTITQGETLVEPQGNASSSRRQRGRGGSWNDKQANCTATAASSVDPWNSTYYIWGVRLCLTIKKTAE